MSPGLGQELAFQYALKHDDPPEDYRKARVVSLRNALLAAQSFSEG